MTFKEAAAFIMPWGQYEGRTLDQIAQDDEGLKYLDWLRDKRMGDGWARFPIDDALDAYLDDPAIKKELEELR